jgi:sortase system peptidoglycan-associated protein
MNNILSKSILAISLTLPLSILTPAFANNAADEANKTYTEQGLGFGTGAAMGGLVAGPIGVVTGAFIGSLIGQNISNENEVTKLSNSNSEVTNKYKITSEKVKTLEEVNTQQSAVLNDAHRTIEKLFAQNQELKNHALNFDVQFRTNSIDIEKQYQEYLKDLAKTLNTTPNLEIEVAGFADRTGDEDFNMLLSDQRAKQVKEFLIEQGIEEDRITTLAHGETQPLHADENLENNFFDRRVSIFIMPIEIGAKNIAEEIMNAEKELSVAIK